LPQPSRREEDEDDRGEVRPSLRQPPVFHPKDYSERWEVAVTIYLANVPKRSMGPYILSFLSEEAARIFHTTGICPTPPAPVIWEALRREISANGSVWACKPGNAQNFTFKPAENLSVALIKARVCGALEQLDEKQAAEESICLAFSQHSLKLKPIPRPVRPTILTEIVVNMKPTSVKGGNNKETALFLIDTEASFSLICAQLADRLTKHQKAPVKPVRLFTANGAEMQVASYLSARVQFVSFSGEHQFLTFPKLQLEAILRMDFLGRFGGVINLKDSQMTIGSCVVGLEKGRPVEVCSTVDSKTSRRVHNVKDVLIERSPPVAGVVISESKRQG
ncbi:hypothetical protein EG68_11712, partial [Paragonimus skrjabini miyazakii]